MDDGEATIEQVRARYALAARAVDDRRSALTVLDDGASSCCGGEVTVEPAFGQGLYSADEQGELPDEAVLASLGCGNPVAVADLREGERVLDLGSGGGIDVLLSARRVGPAGKAFGLDMTDEMLELARANAAKAGDANVEFLKGVIEDIPLADASVDVVISNCVVNLSTDKPAVLSEMYRVLTPGGRIGISDVVAEDRLTPAQRAERGSYVGCIAGALSRTEYVDGLVSAGFEAPEVRFTHQVADGLHGAIVRAVKPADAPAARPVLVFEGPLCCNTGVCGPDPAQQLVSFSADCAWLSGQGAPVTRANLAQDPVAFASNPAAAAFLRISGAAGLPLVMVDGVTVLTGRYPTREELAQYAGLGGASLRRAEVGQPTDGECCSGSSCCEGSK